MPVTTYAENRFAASAMQISWVAQALQTVNPAPAGPDPRIVVSQRLAEASQSFLQRRYQEAISAYTAASALLGSIPASAGSTPPEQDSRYVVAFGLAESYHAVGDYDQAETQYQNAAQVSTLANNPDAAKNLWLRLATLYLDWGNALYRQDDPHAALPLYQNLLLDNNVIPDSSPLYSSALLKPGADIARRAASNLVFVDKFMGDPESLAELTNNPQLISVNPVILSLLLEARQQMLKIAAGLDFWGHSHASVPIWTFDYLQSAAINFCNLAINAEKDTINFWSQADQGTLNRRQLQQNVAQSGAEVQAAQAQADAAQAEVDVYQAGLDLANQRATNALQNAQDYESLSAEWIVHQAVASQLGSHTDGSSLEVEAYADKIQSGPPFTETGYRVDYSHGVQQPEVVSYTYQTNKLRGNFGTLSAARQLVSARLNREYEVASLQRQAGEMQLAAGQAQKELDLAGTRLKAAQHSTAVAYCRAQAARDNLAAFNAQRFTPEVWHLMGDAMYQLYQRYKDMALRTARLMQQAYNFENDCDLGLIKTDYTVEEVGGLLGADMLMADIQSFTYHQVTTQTSKPQPVKQTISLAERYGYLFESQLRKTGVMEFQTRLEDFDDQYPGTYAGRIEGVDVEIIGLLPPRGVSGSLTNGGVSLYRKPLSRANSNPETRIRVQSSETLILSDYDPARDTFRYTPDQRKTRIFEGAGLASTWRLELPTEINDLDFNRLTDVQITFYYQARFDPELGKIIRQQHDAAPGANARQRALPLRWTHADEYASFISSGDLRIEMAQADFPRSQLNPMLTQLGVVVMGEKGFTPTDLAVSLAAPGKPAQTDQTAADGSLMISADSPLLGGPAVGQYAISLRAASGEPLLQNGRMPVANLALIIGYTFTPRC